MLSSRSLWQRAPPFQIDDRILAVCMECSKLNGELSKSHNGNNRIGRAVRDEEEEENYFTLAKAGGRKGLDLEYILSDNDMIAPPFFIYTDLLIFQEFAKTSEHDKPTPYPWVDWFDDRMPPSVVPVANEGSPYIHSDLLTWKLPPEQSHSKKHHKQLPSNRQRKLTYPAMTKPIQIKGKQTKLPSMYVIKPHIIIRTCMPTYIASTYMYVHICLYVFSSSGPVLMKELLSMNYQKEWLKLNDDRNAEEKRKINVRMGIGMGGSTCSRIRIRLDISMWIIIIKVIVIEWV